MGAFRLLGHGRAARAVHDRQIGFADDHANLTWGAFTALVFSAPSIGGWIGDKILGARRCMTIGAIILALGYFMLALPFETLGFHVYVARRDRGRQRLFQIERGESRAPHLRRRRRAHRQCIHDLLYGGEHRLDLFDARHAVDQGPLGLAHGVRGVQRRRHGARPAQLRTDAQDARANRFRARRCANSLEEPLHSVGGQRGAGGIDRFHFQHKAVAVACVYAAGVAILAIFGYMLTKCDRSERASLVAALILRASGHPVLRVLSADVDVAHALRAAQRRSGFLDCRRESLHVERGAVSGAQSDLDHAAQSPILAFAYTRLARQGRDIPVAARYALGFVVAVGFFIFGLSGRYAEGRVSSWFGGRVFRGDGGIAISR